MQILKIGGSALTEKKGFMKARKKVMRGLAREIAKAVRKKVKLLIVHGAGSFGHPHVLMHRIDNGIRNKEQKLGFAKTHASVSLLSHMLISALIKEGVPAVSIPPLAILTQKNKRISRFDFRILRSLLSKGYVPVLHGDIVLDEKLGGSVVSGDQICAYLGKKAERIIFTTDVDGIFVKGRLVREINAINKEEILREVEGAKGVQDVTGGMKGKLLEIMRTRTPSYIVNANYPRRVGALLLGKKTICTRIKL